MNVLIVADIHGNATALRAVLDDAGDVDVLWCVGDIVGYGPDPSECIGMVREIPNVCIAGNHDVGVAGNISSVRNVGNIEDAGTSDNAGGNWDVGFAGNADSAGITSNAVDENAARGISAGSFNSEARIARDWTRSVLNEDEILFLAKLPLMAEPLTGVLMAHGAPIAGVPVFRAYNVGEFASGLSNSNESVSSEPSSSGPGSGAPGLYEDASDGPVSSKPGSNAPPLREHNYNSSIYDEDANEAVHMDINAYENTPPQGEEQDLKKVSNGNLGIWEYVTSSWQAEEIFSMSQHGFSQGLFIVGHTHVPLAFVKGDDAGVEYVPLETGDIIELDFASFKYLLNPGSVGQPRDGDPRASFMLYDTEANVIEYRRVEYDVAEVMDRVDSVGLPHNLGARLEIGL